MKKLNVLMAMVSISTLLFSGCGDKTDQENAKSPEANKTTSQASASKDAVQKQKRVLQRKKVTDKEAAKLLLAQTREMMELVGMPKSAINDKMSPLEMDVRDHENNLSTVVTGLRIGLERQGMEPCVSENNEVLHVKTGYEKVVMEYAKSRNQVGTDMLAMVFAFRSLPEDEQKEAAEKLEKMMK